MTQSEMSSCNPTITAEVVQENQRMDVLPALFGSAFMRGENLITGYMRNICAGYGGGYWDFIRLSNGGFYLRPDMDTVELSIAGNGFEKEVSADAAGIVVTLYALNILMWDSADSDRDELLNHLYQQSEMLKDYAETISERSAIYRAID
jgi:hypothetical protein